MYLSRVLFAMDSFTWLHINACVVADSSDIETCIYTVLAECLNGLLQKFNSIADSSLTASSAPVDTIFRSR